MAVDWAENVRKYAANADSEIIRGIVNYCGIALRKRDSQLVSFGDDKETGRVRDNFLKKKLALSDSDASLNTAIASVGEVMKGENFKNRVTVYYLLAEKFGKLELFRPKSAAKGSKASDSGNTATGAAAAAGGALGVAALASAGSGNADTPAAAPTPKAEPVAVAKAEPAPAPAASVVKAFEDKAQGAVGATGAALGAAGAAVAGVAGAAALGASGLASKAGAAVGDAAGAVTGAVGDAAGAVTGAVGDAAGAVTGAVGGLTGSSDDGEGGGLGWLWWLLGLLLAAFVLWWLFLRGPSGDADGAAAGSDTAAEAPATDEAGAAEKAAVATGADGAALPAEGTVTIPAGAGVTSESRDGKPFVKVYFDTGKTAVVPAFAPAAAAVKQYLDTNPGSSLEVAGFNDPRGNPAANAALSAGRADAVKADLVKAELVKAGIADTAIALVKPAASTDTASDLAGARRVEVVIK